LTVEESNLRSLGELKNGCPYLWGKILKNEIVQRNRIRFNTI